MEKLRWLKRGRQTRKKKQMMDRIEENYDDGLNEIEVLDGLRLP